MRDKIRDIMSTLKSYTFDEKRFILSIYLAKVVEAYKNNKKERATTKLNVFETCKGKLREFTFIDETYVEDNLITAKPIKKLLITY